MNHCTYHVTENNMLIILCPIYREWLRKMHWYLWLELCSRINRLSLLFSSPKSKYAQRKLIPCDCREPDTGRIRRETRVLSIATLSQDELRGYNRITWRICEEGGRRPISSFGCSLSCKRQIVKSSLSFLFHVHGERKQDFTIDLTPFDLLPFSPSFVCNNTAIRVLHAEDRIRPISSSRL